MIEDKKQAILIMCHNDFYILEKSLELLDNPKIDFYIHIDAKTKDFDYDKINSIVKKSKIFYIDRIEAIWGNYSLIEIELMLIKEAQKNEDYSYLHLISGSDLPIKPVDEIISYFNKKYPMEFIGYNDFDGIKESMLNRIKYFSFVTENFRYDNEERELYSKLMDLQRKTGVDRLKDVDMDIRVGANWFSITNELAKYVISKESLIKRLFSYGYCPDELFLQTIVYNSSFINNVCREYTNDNLNCKRLIDWNRGSPYVFRSEDYEQIMNSSAMFARKFSTSIDKNIIDMIYMNIKSCSRSDNCE